MYLNNFYTAICCAIQYLARRSLLAYYILYNKRGPLFVILIIVSDPYCNRIYNI
nr:MAG TPA: hypothetical protein [Caudoviricetes sp.]